jgi:hypothetical protein
MDNFPRNSYEPRQERPERREEKPDLKVVPLVKSPVIRRKKPLGIRLQEMLFGGDTKGVFEKVYYDVLVPAFKDMVSDAFDEAKNRIMFGESRGNRRSSSRPSAFSGGSNQINYNRYSGPKRDERPSSMSRVGRASHNFDDIIMSNRAEAESVIDQLRDIIEEYGHASVRNLYELVDEKAHATDENWGWFDLRHASVRHVSNGYLLNLPKTHPLD